MLNVVSHWLVTIPGGMLILEAMPWLALALIVYAIWVFIQHYRVFNRQQVEGVVQKSELVSEFNGGMNKSSMFQYFADLEFAFEVDGKKIISKKTSSFELNVTVDPLAGEKLSRFPLGKKVVVYLNPDHPEKSIIGNVFPYNIYLLGLVAVVLYMLHDAFVYTIFQEVL